MTRKQALIELRDKVKAGDTSRAWLLAILTNDGVMHKAFGENWLLCFDAHHGSLDAAKALHETVLHEWSTEIRCRPFGLAPHQWHVQISNDHTGWGNGKYCSASNACPSRAWLLAILEALISQENKE